jgi:hypothetical protein
MVETFQGTAADGETFPCLVPRVRIPSSQPKA